MLDRLFSLAGKTALVTGGSRGIGAMIAHGLIAAGARTYIAARKREELEVAVASMPDGECLPLVADLSTVEGVRLLAAELAAREERLHVLVNNAGATWGAPLDEFPEAGWDKVMDLNVKAMFFMTQALLPSLRAAATPDDPARVVNIASIHGLRHSGMENFAYTAGKAAVLRLTTHLAAALARDHVNVNAIAPGLFDTSMTAFLLDDEGGRAAQEAGIPAGRTGRMEDAAGTAIYLASRASAFVTGACLVLDGGAVAAA